MYFCAKHQKHKTMKKHLLLILLAVVAVSLHAQNDGQKSEMYKIMSHDMGEYQFTIENFMRQHDGDFLFNAFVSVEGSNPYSPVGVGDILYKVSPTSLTVTDTLFVEDPEAPYYLFAPNPIGEGNIRANFEYVEACDSTFLRICHFPDNSLIINHDEDIMVPVCAGFAWGQFDNSIVDCRGDLIMKYSKSNDQMSFDHYIARFGPEGTLKRQALLFENQNIVVPKLRMLKESPLQYFQWRDYIEENLLLIVMDSLFQKNTITLNKILHEELVSDTFNVKKYEYLNFNFDTEVIPIGGDKVLVAAQYTCDTNFDPLTAECGAAVAKYDIRTMQMKDYIVFNDYKNWYTPARCLGLKQMSEGTVYFLYREEGYPDEIIVAVKMDTDLNVEWKRYFKTDNISFLWGVPLYFPILYEDEQGEEQGIAWAGYGTNADENIYLIYFYLNHDGTVGMDEAGLVVRPYAYYPNPTKDQLHLQFSPDVTPKQIELYDLQGRLVRTQRNGLETLEMSGLAAGTYTMRVTMENGQVFSDKVVKE